MQKASYFHEHEKQTIKAFDVCVCNKIIILKKNFVQFTHPVTKGKN
jgi:hypothetical protein